MVDPESGDMQMTLTTEGPATPRLYIGRTRESEPCCSPSLGSALLHPSQAWQWLSDPQKAIWASNHELQNHPRRGCFLPWQCSGFVPRGSWKMV